MKRLVLVLACLVLTVCLTACQNGDTVADDTPKSDSNSALENGLNESLEETFDRDLSTLVSVEDLSEVFGTEMVGPEMMDYDSVAGYQNESGSLIVELLAENSSKSEFEAMIESISDAVVEAPNLGEISYWVSEYKTIYTFSGKYMASVTIYADTIAENDALIFSRQVMLKMLENLE